MELGDEEDQFHVHTCSVAVDETLNPPTGARTTEEGAETAPTDQKKKIEEN